MVKYAITHAPFFRKLYSGFDPDDFFSLPVTDKKLMMANLTEYNTLGLNGDELVRFALDVEKNRDFTIRFHGINIGMSSGTSGNKGIIITTPREEKYLKALYVSRLVLPRKEKLNGAFILRVTTPAFNFKRFGHKLTYVNQLQVMEKVIGEIEKIKPNVISAPPSMLRLLAKEQEKGTLHVHPKILYSYAEVLHPDVREYLIRTFSCPVHEVYQGSEGCYAMTCREGRLHINEDIIFFELLDDHGRPVPDGLPCHTLLVTDLYKTSQPVIRYALNDILTISPEKCPCGSRFRVIERIQGRADDMIWGIRKGTGERHFIFQDYLSRKIITLSDEIEEHQVIQEFYTSLLIRLLLKPDADAPAIFTLINKGIQEIFTAYDCVEPDIRIESGPPEINPDSSKLTRIICRIKHEN